MNRVQFMTELAALLQDISAEERIEAMQYYNDYFDDAGAENEQEIMNELGSPAKVAGEVKAGLWGQGDEAAEFRETGYTDTRFEQRETPADQNADRYANRNKEDYDYSSRYGNRRNYREDVPPRTNTALKVVLIIVFILFGLPILLPLAIGAAVVVLALVLTTFIVFFAFVLASIAIVIAGVLVFCVGIANLIPAVAVGLALVGAGLLIAVIGLIATVGSVRLCIIVLPGICRGVVWLCRRPFAGRAVA